MDIPLSRGSLTISWNFVFCVGVIFLLAVVGRSLWSLAYDLLGVRGTGLAIWILFCVVAVVAIVYDRRLAGSLSIVKCAAIVGGAFLYALTFQIAEERMHIATFGVLGWLFSRDNIVAFKRRTPLIACCACTIIAVLDETFQSFLPHRVGDPRDVLIGAIGGLLGALIFTSKTFSELEDM